MAVTNFTSADYFFDDREDYYTNVDYTLPDSFDFLDQAYKNHDDSGAFLTIVVQGIKSVFFYDGDNFYGLMAQALIMTISFVAMAFTYFP